MINENTKAKSREETITTKKEFFKKLKPLLPFKVRKEILADFEEHFSVGEENGKSEEEIVKELGSAEEIAKEYNSDLNGERIQINTMSSRIWSGVGIFFFDIFIGLPILCAIFSLWLSLWSVVISIAVTAIAIPVTKIVFSAENIFPWFVNITAAISLLGLAGALTILMIYLSGYFFTGMKWVIRFHGNLISRRVKPLVEREDERGDR